MVGKGKMYFANMNLIGEGVFGDDFRNLKYRMNE